MENLNKFYTYAYLREDGTPYYIGKGKGKRLYKKSRGEVKLPKDKSRVIFLKKNLTEEEAFKHEIYMISIFGRKDLKTGILRNKTNGGEGSSGRSITTKEIEKHKITGNWCVKNKIGFHGCAENYMKMSRMKGSMKSKETCSREFIIKNLNGEIIKGKNVSEFCRQNGFYSGNFLQMLNGKQNVAYGYVLPETKITYYKIISPKGDEYTITNFDKYHEFCKEHNLTLSGFGRMLSGKFSHRNWKLVDTFYR